MLALSVEDVKGFMIKLLKESTFDGYRLHSAVIVCAARFEIYTEAESHCGWADMRGYAYNIIKGAVSPKSIKIVLGYDVHSADLPEAAALFLNIHFENSKIDLTTGMSVKSFTLDKSGERSWDDFVMKFLDSAGIKYTTL